jgi:hypothetical protein
VVKGVMIQLAQELPRELGPGAAHMVLQVGGLVPLWG